MQLPLEMPGWGGENAIPAKKMGSEQNKKKLRRNHDFLLAESWKIWIWYFCQLNFTSNTFFALDSDFCEGVKCEDMDIIIKI